MLSISQGKLKSPKHKKLFKILLKPGSHLTRTWKMRAMAKKTVRVPEAWLTLTSCQPKLSSKTLSSVTLQTDEGHSFLTTARRLTSEITRRSEHLRKIFTCQTKNSLLSKQRLRLQAIRIPCNCCICTHLAEGGFKSSLQPLLQKTSSLQPHLFSKRRK